MKALLWAWRHKRLVGTGLIIAILLTVTGCAKMDARHWRAKYEEADRQALNVLVAIRDVAANPQLAWKDAAAQVRLVGQSRDSWRDASRRQSEKIRQMAEETERLKKLSAEAQRVARRLIAKRESAIAKLERRALTPGDRSDCARQLREAEEALDAVWEAGL